MRLAVDKIWYSYKGMGSVSKVCLSSVFCSKDVGRRVDRPTSTCSQSLDITRVLLDTACMYPATVSSDLVR